MNKKTNRFLKKGTKVLRKTMKRAGGPIGLTAGALTLGGVAALAFNDDVRARSRGLASGALDKLRRMTGGTGHAELERAELPEHTH